MTSLRGWRLAGAGAMAAALAWACGAAPGPAPFGPADEAAIRALDSAYVAAWLRSDTAGVLATLDSSALMVPPGHEPVRGRDAIRAFWWPAGGAPFVITHFESAIEEVGGRDDLAWTRGRSTVTWTSGSGPAARPQVSTNLSLDILRRGADGRWRISRHTWGPSLPAR